MLIKEPNTNNIFEIQLIIGASPAKRRKIPTNPITIPIT
ncbi:MAG: hypothetical protein JWQ25_1092, partial [Daejeonella sp.]|nr:hypothetical protein [Daejeonella sp.]